MSDVAIAYIFLVLGFCLGLTASVILLRAPRASSSGPPLRNPGPPESSTADNWLRYCAQSTLTGIPMRDLGPAPLLPTDQARDVVRWRYPQLRNAA
ncbi:hypothetical protein [Lysobacter sp. Root96]|uniref:hypothetical protein n=1 Tax=Lysobacter sp. Root96 TaxID=1736612 RepID=UPI0006FBC978|nr:hypothetical protein [Lysobacter sp. Root96]KRD71405.1 hypothetical protein ASE45_06235 [Lysobacter sp. Root96]